METKKCCKCGIEKTLIEFNKSKDDKFGVRSSCKACAALYNKSRWHSNDTYRLKRLKQARDWKASNKTEVLAYSRKYHSDHKERGLVKNAEWKKNNADKQLAIRAKIKKKQSSSLSKTYVVEKLSQQGITITPETIELKKQIILIKRFKKQVNEKSKSTSPK
jgi:hypothetical protein